MSSMLRTSLVFMPRMEATVLRGRKMMVTMVNAYMAVSCLSLFVSMLRRFFVVELVHVSHIILI